MSVSGPNIRKSSGPFCCDSQRSLLSIRSGSRLSSRELIGKLNHHPRGFERGQGQKRFANMGRRQGAPCDLRSGRPSRAGSRPLRCEQGQSSILACQVRLGFRSARALQGNYLAMDKPRPDEEPNCIGPKSQEGNCRLQQSDWAPGGFGGAVDFLLRAGFQFRRILQLRR